MTPLVVILCLVLLLPALFYGVHGGGKTAAWGIVSTGEQVRGGIYRVTRTTLWKRGSAPISVRVAAFSSFFLGQMIVPGAFAALVGWLVLLLTLTNRPSPVHVVLTLSSPTGLVVAAHLFSAGAAMLDRSQDAVFKARRAASWALWHNVVLLVGLGGAVWLAQDEAPYALASACYAAVSIAQALVVRHAASAIEAYKARQEAEGAPAELAWAYWAQRAA